MLRSLAEPEGYRLHATDDEIGRCRDFLIDDQQWAVRYMVADTRTWLPGRKVLVSPAQLGTPDWAAQRLPVAMTREQLEQSPPLDEDAPVSRRYEQAFNTAHGLPAYWLGSGLWGDYPAPSTMMAPQEMYIEPAPTVPEEPDTAEPVDPAVDDRVHLRSLREITGYDVRAGGDSEAAKVGRLKDMIVDDERWAVRYLVVDTSRLPFSKQVLLPVELVTDVDWASRTVRTEATEAQVEEAPEFDPTEPVNARMEAVLYDYYGRAHARVG